MEKIAKCIRETGNWSNLEKEHRFDSSSFSREKVSADIQQSAPKLYALINKIKELDDADMKKHGKLFKHFIYSDVKSLYGAKLIASALAAHGYTHAYDLVKTSKGMSFKLKSNLDKYDGHVFATLTSVLFFEKPIGVRFRKDLLATYNKRPDNVHGEHVRIIILDSGFREGIDLFDVKYVHIFEPLMTRSDEKQAIGRATRFCGQKGLHFEKNVGWPLHVYKYETTLPKDVSRAILANNPDLAPADNFFNLFLKFSNIDPKKINFANQLEPLAIYSAVDRSLTKNVHNFEIEDLTANRNFNEIFSGGKKQLTAFQKMQRYIRENYSQFKWPVTKVENGCMIAPVQSNNNGPSIIQFSPTQNFVRNYFTTKADTKGLLLMHSVGTGKTCSAIAVASSSFEKEDYTIIYVTRHTLKADVWKNMFGQTCSVIIQDLIKKGVSIPEATAQRARMIKAWMQPISYKQFSNALQGKNSIYHDLVKRNGKKDVLRKTLVIIDEAHKLFAPDVTGGEKPDTDEIKKALLHSYETSGKNSARLLLMTATPYTDDPMDMIRLLNMLKEKDEQMPETFEEFQRVYLDEEGKFTNSGKDKLLDDLTGYISYLNREKDVRSFAYPVVNNIHVDLSRYEFVNELNEFIEINKELNHQILEFQVAQSEFNTNRINYSMKLKEQYEETLTKMREDLNNCKNNQAKYIAEKLRILAENKKDALKECSTIKKDCQTRIKEMAKENANNTKEKVDQCKAKEKACIEDIKAALKDQIKAAKDQAKDDNKKCKKGDTECKETIKAGLEKKLISLKESAKEEETDCKIQGKKCKEDAKQFAKDAKKEKKEDLKFDIKECDSDPKYLACTERVNNEYQKGKEQIDNEDPCKIKQEQIKQYVEIQKQIMKTQLHEFTDNEKKKLQKDEEKLKEIKAEWAKIRDDVLDKAKSDRSQEIYLEECLKDNNKKLVSRYKRILRGEIMDSLDDDGIAIEEEDLPSDTKANIYIINGHGSETLVDFNKRYTMPDDKVLIVFPVCAKFNYMNISCLFMDIFNDPKNLKWMMDPLRYQSQIEKELGYPIRIFLPGDKVPDMSTTLFLEFELEKTVIAKSGVFQVNNIPSIERKRFKETTNAKYSLGDKSCFKYSGILDNPNEYNKQVHHEVFKGNVYEKAATSEGYSSLKKRSFKVKDILNDVGPGIYFYTGCRAFFGKIPEKLYENILLKSAAQQREKSRADKMKLFKPYLKIETKEPVQPSPLEDDGEIEEKKDQEDIEQETEADGKMINKIVNKMKKEVAAIFEEVNYYSEDEKKDKVGVIDKYISQILKLKLDVPVNFYAIKEILSGNLLPVESLSFKKEKRTYTLNIVDIYEYEKKKYMVVKSKLGVIPSNMKNTNVKCDSQLLMKRIKKIYKDGNIGFLQIPKAQSEYENEQVFVDLCNLVKKLYIHKKTETS